MINWITPSIGTAAWDGFEPGTDAERLDVRDLVDHAGNGTALVLAKIERALEALQAGRRVVVCCDLGMSRSNAIAAGVLSRAEGLPLAAAIRRVMAATGERRIKVELLAAVGHALDEFSPADAAARPRVVVLGGTGFVGRRLMTHLAGRVDAIAVSRADADISLGAAELYLATVAHHCDVVVHLARPRVIDNRGLGEALTMLRNTLDVCRDAGAALVYLSSAEVFSGHVGAETPATEELPRRPGNVGGETKALCEELIEHHVQRHGLKRLIVRAATLFDDAGSRPLLIRKFVELALRGQEIVTHRYRNGAPVLDLLHVDDAARAIAELVARRETGTFHLGAGGTLTTGDLARTIVRLTGSASLVSETDIESDCANTVLDGSKLARCIDWRPQHQLGPSLDEAIFNRKREASR